ncbi:MAG: DNA-processing protein DprA [Pseudomonadota bacterium]
MPLLSDAQRLNWLRLARTPRIGPVRFQELINLFGSAEEALSRLPSFTARKGQPLHPPAVAQIEAEMEAAQRLGAHFVARGEAGYPIALATTDRPPPLLCTRGAAQAVANRPMVAIVGSRNASAGALAHTKQVAADLGAAGIIVVSGLARGIDAAAHLGALSSGTIAFFGGGLGEVYPPEHQSLADSIADSGGALYSEMPLNWSPRAQDFPRRNRLVAGASLALLVVEAAIRSGSLITTRQANDLGRIVMATPGFPLDPRSVGPNQLLRDGANLVRNAQDILEDLGPMLDQQDAGETFASLPAQNTDTSNDTNGFSEDFTGGENSQRWEELDGTMASALSISPTTFDLIVEAAGVAPGPARAWLLEHELAGEVVRYPGDRFACAPPQGS